MLVTSHRSRGMFLTIARVSTMFLVSFFVLSIPSASYAQLNDTTIANTYIVSGDIAEFGDLISFDPTTQTFHLAQEVSDPNLFGVVVTNPAIVLRTSAKGVPIVTSGEVYVQVTTINGSITAGDSITSSIVPGKGQKADSSAPFIIGTALDSFPITSTSTVAVVSTSTVDGGSIRVLLAIGPSPSSTEGSVGDGDATGNPTTLLNVLGVSTPLATLIKYALATLVVIGSVYVAFRNFGSNMKDSIISVGRNPLAKTSIQSMVVLNTVLIVLVSIAGLFIGLLILFVKL